MRHTYTALLLALLTAAAQTTKPPDSPTGTILRFDVDLVQVDAVVTDSKGNHVSGLQPADFEVLQDGKPQKITHFSYVPAAQPASPDPAPNQEIKRTVVILVADTRLTSTSFDSVKKSLDRYIDQVLQPGDLVSIERLSGNSGALEQFTSDRTLLHLAVRQMVWKPRMRGAPLLRGIQETLLALTDLPGRKSVVVISPGSGRNIMTAGEELRQIADEANRAAVTVNPIDVRGLSPLTPGADLDAIPEPPNAEESIMVPTLLGQMGAHTQSQDVMSYLASMTGGIFLHDGNDLFAQLKTAVDDSAGYYLLGWYPGANAFKSRQDHAAEYHKVQVKVRRKGLEVRSREGFAGVPGGATSDLAPVPGPSADAQMQRALFSPFGSNGIDLRLTASYGYDDKLGQYVESQLYVHPKGIEFHDGKAGCKAASFEWMMTAVALDSDLGSKGQLNGDRPTIEVCGKGSEDMLKDGIVAVMRKPVAQPAAYQVRVALRNLTAGETPPAILVGSASQTVEVPDQQKDPLSLTGVALWSRAGNPDTPTAGVSYRAAVAGDPAVRQFHPGESLTYSFRLSVKDFAQPVTTRIKVMRDGKEVYTSEPLQITPGAPFAGTYKLDNSAAPGSYVFGVVSTQPATKNEIRAEQWIDFEVIG